MQADMGLRCQNMPEDTCSHDAPIYLAPGSRFFFSAKRHLI